MLSVAVSQLCSCKDQGLRIISDVVRELSKPISWDNRAEELILCHY